jgi:hypothetical protein
MERHPAMCQIMKMGLKCGFHRVRDGGYGGELELRFNVHR